MVSFSCENCGDVLTKKKLDPHRNQCRGASYTCIDCMTHFQGFDYRAHTSCISEAQKYMGHLYREKDNKKGKGQDRRKSGGGQENNNPAAMGYHGAYVEDEGAEQQNAVAIVDVPPRAPTPPPAAPPQHQLEDNSNVFDYLVEEPTPNRDSRYNGYHQHGDSQYSNDDSQQAYYQNNGYAYGHSAVTPSFDRYASYSQNDDSQQSNALMPPPAGSYVTPAPKARGEKKSEKKRKRDTVEDLDLSAKRPVSRSGDDSQGGTSVGRTLHSGLTGGLSRLITDPEFYDDRIDAGPTPVSPLKRSKREADYDRAAKDERRKSHAGSVLSQSTMKTSRTGASADDRQRKRSARHRADSFSSADDDEQPRSGRKATKAIEYNGNGSSRGASAQPSATNQLAVYGGSRAALFMSFINKGPDSERGYSLNKALKRYHREREGSQHHDAEREEDDKELFKSLRLRRNSRGEVVLFA